MSKWRVGTKVPINVYEGDRPVCQCHTAADAKRIVSAMNAEPVEYPSADELTKFENWAKGKNLPTMPNGDVYVHVESQMAWEAWQARAKLRDVSPAKGGGE